MNGAAGIAVGMATNMPPHNLSEVCDGILAYIDNKDIDTEGLMEHIKGPDFPTGGVIYGVDGIREAYETGRGKVVLRAKCHIEEDDRRRVARPSSSPRSPTRPTRRCSSTRAWPTW